MQAVLFETHRFLRELIKKILQPEKKFFKDKVRLLLMAEAVATGAMSQQFRFYSNIRR